MPKYNKIPSDTTLVRIATPIKKVMDEYLEGLSQSGSGITQTVFMSRAIYWYIKNKQEVEK